VVLIADEADLDKASWCNATSPVGNPDYVLCLLTSPIPRAAQHRADITCCGRRTKERNGKSGKPAALAPPTGASPVRSAAGDVVDLVRPTAWRSRSIGGG
jgi:hypothetical protein